MSGSKLAPAVEANVDGLIGPTHNYAGLSPGNLASAANQGAMSNPRAAALEGLAKMRLLAGVGLPQFVLPPQERPDRRYLERIGADVGTPLDPAGAVAAGWSASAMWAANAATVTPSADSGDGRVHFTPANLVTQLHRSLEPEQTTRALRALFPDRERFVIHDPLPAHPRFADEGAANHVRLCADHGEPGVELLVWGRAWGDDPEAGYPARQTIEACQSIFQLHGSQRPTLARQSRTAIDAGAFHNDVVCVGAKTCLLHHELAFESTGPMHDVLRRSADGLFEPAIQVVSEAELPLSEAIRSYLFNSMLVSPPGEDRLVLIAPAEVAESAAASAVADRLVSGNGPIGRVEYVDVRQSMRNGGGPACLRLRVVLTEGELAAANGAQRFTPALDAALTDWVGRRYRDRLTPGELGDPALADDSRAALDELTGLLELGGAFYPFQRG